VAPRNQQKTASLLLARSGRTRPIKSFKTFRLDTVNHLPWRNGDRVRAQQHQDYSESTGSTFEWAKGINQDRRAGANCSRLFSVGNQRPRCERSGQYSISVHQRGGLNVDITPHIHPDGDDTLKIVLDVSSVVTHQPIGGINEHVIGQRKVEHEIRPKDGETSLLGGMVQQRDTQSLAGVPGLSQIPILKYLFSQKNAEVTDNEIVFAVIPHIVRRMDPRLLYQCRDQVERLNSCLPQLPYCATSAGAFS